MTKAAREWSTVPDRRSARAVPAFTSVRTRQPALTRREARVRRILLKELERMNEWKRLTYSEKHHLEKQLDSQWIDRELVRMEKTIRRSKYFLVVAIPLVLFMLGTGVLSLAIRGFDFHYVFWLLSPLYLGGPILGIKATRRKMFIYEALRELSDAEEMDVVLDQSVEQADDLIRWLIDREMEIEDSYPLRALVRR